MPSLKLVGDAYVMASDPQRNGGAEPALQVGLAPQADEFVSYLRFDLGVIPPGSAIAAARLSLFALEVSGEAGPVRVSRVMQPWEEYQINYASQPQADQGTSSMANVSVPGWQSWDVTEIVKSWVAGGFENNGFSVGQQEGPPHEMSFVSREGGDDLRPRLEVAFRAPGGTLGGASGMPGRLHDVSPNPVRGRADIRFSLAAAGPVSVQIYAADGRLVRSLVSGSRAAGDHRVALDARGLSNGAYSVRMVAGDIVSTIPLVKAE